MPAGPYFKQAAASLRNAIGEMRRENDERRRALNEKEKNMHKRKDGLLSDKNWKETMAGDSNTDAARRAVLLKEAHDDLTEVTNIERDFKADQDRLVQEIAQTDRDIIDLEKDAQDLEGRQ